MTDLTSNIQTGKNFQPSSQATKAVFGLSVSSASAGTINFMGQIVNLAAGDVDTAAHLTSKLQAVVIPGWTITGSSPNVTAQSKAAGIGNIDPFMAAGTATGITWTTTITLQDQTYYVNTNSVAVGNANVSVMLNKIN
jgi:hypothetical protein